MTQEDIERALREDQSWVPEGFKERKLVLEDGSFNKPHNSGPLKVNLATNPFYRKYQEARQARIESLTNEHTEEKKNGKVETTMTNANVNEMTVSTNEKARQDSELIINKNQKEAIPMSGKPINKNVVTLTPSVQKLVDWLSKTVNTYFDKACEIVFGRIQAYVAKHPEKEAECAKSLPAGLVKETKQQMYNSAVKTIDRSAEKTGNVGLDFCSDTEPFKKRLSIAFHAPAVEAVAKGLGRDINVECTVVDTFQGVTDVEETFEYICEQIEASKKKSSTSQKSTGSSGEVPRTNADTTRSLVVSNKQENSPKNEELVLNTDSNISTQDVENPATVEEKVEDIKVGEVSAVETPVEVAAPLPVSEEPRSRSEKDLENFCAQYVSSYIKSAIKTTLADIKEKKAAYLSKHPETDQDKLKVQMAGYLERTVCKDLVTGIINDLIKACKRYHREYSLTAVGATQIGDRIYNVVASFASADITKTTGYPLTFTPDINSEVKTGDMQVVSIIARLASRDFEPTEDASKPEIAPSTTNITPENEVVTEKTEASETPADITTTEEEYPSPFADIELEEPTTEDLTTSDITVEETAAETPEEVVVTDVTPEDIKTTDIVTFDISSEDTTPVAEVEDIATVDTTTSDTTTKDITVADIAPAELTREERVEMAAGFYNKLYQNVPVGGEYYTYVCYFEEVKPANSKPYTRCHATSFKVSDEEGRRAMAEKSIELSENTGKDIYFGVNLTATATNKRAIAKDVVAQVAVITDIDTASNHHSGGSYVPDTDTAVSLLPFEATLVNASGGGIHAYNVLETPITFSDNKEKDLIKARLNKTYINVIDDKAKASGYEGVDSVEDLPRILRAPGTLNTRENVYCKVIKTDGKTWTRESFEEALTPFVEKISQKKAETRPQNLATAPTDINTSGKKYKPDPAELKEIMIKAIVEFLWGDRISTLGYNVWTALCTCFLNLGLDDTLDALNHSDPREDKIEDIESVRRRRLSEDVEAYGYDQLVGIVNNLGFDPRPVRRAFWTPEKKRQYEGTEYQWWWKGAPLPVISEDISDEDPDLYDKIFFSGDDTDYAHAERLLAFARGKVRYVEERDRFAIFESKEYVDKETGEVLGVGGKWIYRKNTGLIPVAHELANYIRAHSEPDDKFARKLVKTFETHKTLNGIIETLKGIPECIADPNLFDRHPTLLNCANGIIDLESGKLLPARPEYYLTQQAKTVYRPELGTNCLFSRWLEDVVPDEEDRKGLLRYLGYVLTGLTKEQKCLFILGSGRNGKSTLIGVINRLLCDFADTYDIKGMLTSRHESNANDANPTRYKIIGKRFLSTTEIPKGRTLDFNEFKLLVGGDPFSCRPLYGAPITCENPQQKFMFAGNNFPKLDKEQVDNAFIKRLLIVNFPKYFGDNPDTTLLGRLTTEEELSKILNLLVQEAVTYFEEDGLYKSKGMEEAVEQYTTPSDIVAEYMYEFVEKTDNRSDTIVCEAIMNNLIAYYGREEAGDLTIKKVTKKLRELGYTTSAVKGGFTGLRGYRFRNTVNTDTDTADTNPDIREDTTADTNSAA